VTRSVYQALLRLYPWDYATAFSHDMTIAFDQACEEQRARGRGHFVRFATSELSGLLWGAGKEWLAKLTTEESVRGRSLPDLRMMRPVGVTRELWFASLDREGGTESTIAEEQARPETHFRRFIGADLRS
jgi:hypothetical protein